MGYSRPVLSTQITHNHQLFRQETNPPIAPPSKFPEERAAQRHPGQTPLLMNG